MQHGYFILELEHVAFDHGYVFGHRSLARLLDSLDFSKLATHPTADRLKFYEELLKSFPPTDKRRKTTKKKQILREEDADKIVSTMSKKAQSRTWGGKIRDIWCLVFIGGCP